MAFPYCFWKKIYHVPSTSSHPAPPRATSLSCTFIWAKDTNIRHAMQKKCEWGTPCSFPNMFMFFVSFIPTVHLINTTSRSKHIKTHECSLKLNMLEAIIFNETLRLPPQTSTTLRSSPHPLSPAAVRSPAPKPSPRNHRRLRPAGTKPPRFRIFFETKNLRKTMENLRKTLENLRKNHLSDAKTLRNLVKGSGFLFPKWLWVTKSAQNLWVWGWFCSQ